MRKPLKPTTVFLVMLGLWAIMAISARATPYFYLDTPAQWNAAPITPIAPATWADYMTDNPGFYSPDIPATYWSSPPQLYTYDGPVVPGVNEGGLVMAWGETNAGATGTNFTAAWKYTYGLDPNLQNSLVICSVVPPQFNAAGNQVNSVGVGLVDAAGLIRSWTWNCGQFANPALSQIAWNQMWNLSMGPIGPMGQAVDLVSNATSPMNPAVVPPLFFSALPPNPLFNPATVMSIIAIESGQNVGQWVVPPGQVVPLVWNFWGNAGVIPEPGTLALLALGALALGGRARRN